VSSVPHVPTANQIPGHRLKKERSEPIPETDVENK
jgi:hypothetical protein